MAIVSTSSKGQVVIPRDVRRALGLKPGQKVSVTLEGDRAVVVPLPEDPVKATWGMFRDGTSLTKALVAEHRKERRRDARRGA